MSGTTSVLYIHTKRTQISSRVYTLARQTPSLCIPTRIALLLGLDRLVRSQVLIAIMRRTTTLDVEAWQTTRRPQITMAKDSAITAVGSTLPSGRQHMFVFGSLPVTVSLRVSARVLLMSPSLAYPWRTSKAPATLTPISLTTVSSSTPIFVVRGLDLPTRTSLSVR